MDFNKVIIASDSTSDLNKELIEKYDIKVIPMTITLGKDQYTDGVDVDSDKIYEYYNQTKQLPKTSAVNAYQFSEVFEKYIKDGYSIVCFTISSEMSSTFNNARLAASEFENVHIVDTRNLSTGGGLLVLKACELREQGKTAAEIANACRELTDYVDASFVIDNLEFLHKGGRCNAVTVFAANLLKMKPCIMVKGGKMGVGKKYRGSFEMSLKKYIQDQLENVDDLVAICGEMPEIDQIKYIIESVKTLADNKYGIEFDISLVRGQGYYTGAVFEIQSEEFSCSIGGGGRYDNLVGKFTGSPVPAVGFSIGFERIYSILNAKNYVCEDKKNKLAIFYGKESFVKAMQFSKTVKETYDVTLFEMPNKFGKFLNKLAEQGFKNYCVYDEGAEIKELKTF